jgi:MoxR-like ATPase
MLSSYGLEMIVVGIYDDLRQGISQQTGNWDDPSYFSKPSRLIVHLEHKDGNWSASTPATAGNFAYGNTAAHRSIGCIFIRVIPAVKKSDTEFTIHDKWEWILWYAFWPKLRSGSSGEAFSGFDPVHGTFSYNDGNQRYIAAGLVTLNQPDDALDVGGGLPQLTYQQATDAVRTLINVTPQADLKLQPPEPTPIEVYNGLDPSDLDRMVKTIAEAVEKASGATAVNGDEEEPGPAGPPPQIPEFDDLIGIDSEVYRQINDALKSEFKHMLFYGPPGTGKTTLAQRVAGAISESWKLITGSSDWTSQDIIGGYHPLAEGKLKFLPGVLLENFDKPLVFDELNRCDIDKVIGPLFTVLSQQSTTLPYLVDPSDENSARIEILPKGVANLPRSYAPSPQWKLIATINSIDKASLYQMSYALTRRFAWIYIDVPADPHGFMRTYVPRHSGAASPAADSPVPLGDIWAAINKVRPIGPAPILDIIKLIRSRDDAFNFFKEVTAPAEADPYLDGLYMFLLPMLDGIRHDEAVRIANSIAAALHIESDGRAARLTNRLTGLAI